MCQRSLSLVEVSAHAVDVPTYYCINLSQVMVGFNANYTP